MIQDIKCIIVRNKQRKVHIMKNQLIKIWLNKIKKLFKIHLKEKDLINEINNYDMDIL